MSDLMLDVDQAGELKAAFRRGGWTNAEIKILCEGDVLVHVRNVVQGSAVIVSKEEIPLDMTVHVDRTVRPIYPDWVDKVMDPKLENTGPTEYNLATVLLWLHDDQKGGVTTGQVIFDYLREHNMLKSCLSLRDAEGIQKKGVAVFQKIFGNNVVYFWKSVVRDRDSGYLHVPCLCVSSDRVVLDWYWLDDDWLGNEPAARFASS